MKEIVNKKAVIANRVALEFEDGYYVNLGVGVPSLCVNYLPEGVNIMLQGEDGILGMGSCDAASDGQFNCVDAGGTPVTTVPGAAFFDSFQAFGMTRGGHLDCTVLGALEVDESGNVANWCIPGVRMPGMGGAMDILVGAKRVIIAMEHTSKGNIKILKKCKLPLTAVGCVNLIVTELAVMSVTPQGLVLLERHPDYTVEEIQAVTGAKLHVAENLKVMPLPSGE